MTIPISNLPEFAIIKIPKGWVSSFLNEAVFMSSQTLSFFSAVIIPNLSLNVVYHHHFALYKKVIRYIEDDLSNGRIFRGIFITEVERDTYYREAGGHKSAPKVDFARPGGSIWGKWHKSATFHRITHHIPMICKARAIICMLVILWGFDTCSKHASNALPMPLSVSLTNTGTTSGTNTRYLYTSCNVGVFSIETLPRAVFAMDTQALDYTKRHHPSS